MDDTYTRVSTAMQIDGYSLDARKSGMRAYADYNDFEIVGEYEDTGNLLQQGRKDLFIQFLYWRMIWN